MQEYKAQNQLNRSCSFLSYIGSNVDLYVVPHNGDKIYKRDSLEVKYSE